MSRGLGDVYKRQLENRQWITVTAQIAYEFQMAYKKKGPVLYVQKVEPAEAPEDELVYF